VRWVNDAGVEGVDVEFVPVYGFYDFDAIASDGGRWAAALDARPVAGVFLPDAATVQVQLRRW